VSKGLALCLKSQSHERFSMDVKLSRPTSSTNELSCVLSEIFKSLYRPSVVYRATGVVLFELGEPSPSQFTLFEDPKRALDNEKLFEAVDEVADRFGKHSVFFADCARLGRQHAGDRGEMSQRKTDILGGETFRQHLGLPLLRYELDAEGDGKGQKSEGGSQKSKNERL